MTYPNPTNEPGRQQAGQWYPPGQSYPGQSGFGQPYPGPQPYAGQQYPAPQSYPTPVHSASGGSLEPVNAADALARAKRSASYAIIPRFVAIMAGIVVVFAFGFIYDNPASAPSWITVLIAGSICAGCALLTRTLMRKAQYRITVPYAALRLTVMLIAFFVAFAILANFLDGQGVTERSGRVFMRPLFMIGLVTLTVWQLRVAGLFNGNALGLFFRTTQVHWGQVGAVVISPGSAAGQVEIGVRPVPGVELPLSKPRTGEVLTDLPQRVLVRTKDFDLDRLHWALNQSGRTDLQVLERTPDGERVLRTANAPLTPAPPGGF